MNFSWEHAELELCVLFPRIKRGTLPQIVSGVQTLLQQLWMWSKVTKMYQDAIRYEQEKPT